MLDNRFGNTLERNAGLVFLTRLALFYISLYPLDKGRMRDTMARALEGIRVVDLSHVWAAPTTSMYLADLGAEVIHIPFVVAAAVVDGEVGPRQVSKGRLDDPRIHAVADRVEVILDDEARRLFPSKCLARIVIETDREVLESGLTGGRGDADRPLSDDELKRKFFVDPQRDP